MTADQNDPYLYAENAERWQRLTMPPETKALIAQVAHLEQQVAALIAEQARLQDCLQYVSQRAGIQHATLVRHHHRLLDLEANTHKETP